MAGAPNVFDNSEAASHYEDWYAGPGRYADRCEQSLLGKLLTQFPDCTSLLDVGCGTGHFTRWFAANGPAVTGLDRSWPMLVEAAARDSQTYLLGDALKLPLANSSVDLVSMITTLEFLSDPFQTLVEAVRVARRGILLGVLNRWSVQAARRRLSSSPVWRAAHFFSVAELGRLVRRAAGNRLDEVRWQTTVWPLPVVVSLPIPFGGFIGLSARLHDR